MQLTEFSEWKKQGHIQVKLIIEIIKVAPEIKKDIKLQIKGSLYAKYKRLKKSMTRHIFMKFWTTRQGDLKGFQ